MTPALTMPREPWTDMPPDDQYAWLVSLAGAIAAADRGQATALKDPDGEITAWIVPAGAPGPAAADELVIDLGTDENRDYAEEAYWRDYCQACGTSPCIWDGRPDGFHAEHDPDEQEFNPGYPDTLREAREPE